MKTRTATVVVALTFAAVDGLVALLAQVTPTGASRFEVASIRSSTSGPTRIAASQPDRLRATNATVRQTVRFAYDLPRVALVIGGPAWVDSDRFDIEATFAAGAEPARVREMLRALLAERFGFRARAEQRQWPVYHLVFARNDGTLGPKLRRSTIDCASMKDEDIPCVMVISAAGPRGVVRGGKRPWASIVGALGSEALLAGSDRLVIDRTGLTGDFDIDLQWVPQSLDAVLGAGADQGVSIFTALQEQAGLKLEPAREVIDVLVIDSVEQPTPD